MAFFLIKYIYIYTYNEKYIHNNSHFIVTINDYAMINFIYATSVGITYYNFCRNNLLQYKVASTYFIYFVSRVNCDIFDNPQ